MKNKILYFLLIIISCNHFSNNNSKIISDTKTYDFAIPQHLKEYINTKLTEYVIPDTLEYYKDFCFFFNNTSKHFFKYQNPYFVSSDFNDDFKSDYALLLKRNDTLKIAIIYSKNSKYEHWIDENYNIIVDKQNGIQHGLNIEPPRKIDCVFNNEEKSLILKTNGISLYKLEEMLRVYYWENNTFNVFIMKL